MVCCSATEHNSIHSFGYRPDTIDEYQFMESEYPFVYMLNECFFEWAYTITKGNRGKNKK